MKEIDKKVTGMSRNVFKLQHWREIYQNKARFTPLNTVKCVFKSVLRKHPGYLFSVL